MPNYKWSSESAFMFYKLRGIFKTSGFMYESWASVNPNNNKKTYYIQATLSEDDIKALEAQMNIGSQ